MISLEAQERGARAYATLKSYTKDELIEEIRILEHNHAAVEEMYQHGVNRQKTIADHFPDSWVWERTIMDIEGTNQRIMTQGIPIGEECFKIHNGEACKYCQAKCDKKALGINNEH